MALTRKRASGVLTPHVTGPNASYFTQEVIGKPAQGMAWLVEAVAIVLFVEGNRDTSAQIMGVNKQQWIATNYSNATGVMSQGPMFRLAAIYLPNGQLPTSSQGDITAIPELASVEDFADGASLPVYQPLLIMAGDGIGLKVNAFNSLGAPITIQPAWTMQYREGTSAAVAVT